MIDVIELYFFLYSSVFYLINHLNDYEKKRSLGPRLAIRIEKNIQCEKLLGLARGNTKKRGNKKSGECITPIRYNVLHMYIKYFASSFPRYIKLFGGSSYLSHLVVE